MGFKVDIVKELPRFDINLSIECERGEFLVLVGPSGAGKTTILRSIAGLEKPDIGTISFNGEPWFDNRKGIDLPPQQRNLGYVFQEYTLFPHLNVLKNAAFGANDDSIVIEYLKVFDIWHLRHRKPRKLSGGERQRVALAQALAREPDALILDEPFSAVDAVTRRKLQRVLKEVTKAQDLPVIHITHDLDEAHYLADTMMPIVEGRVDMEWLVDKLPPGYQRRKVHEPGGKIVDLHGREKFKNVAEG